MKILHLTLKKKWFDMIASGEKLEEYRDLKYFWGSRLLYKIPVPWGGNWSAWPDIVKGDYDLYGWEAFTFGAPSFETFDAVRFRNGYSKDAPVVTMECSGITINEGNTEWGAEPGKKYFVIKLGKKITEGQHEANRTEVTAKDTDEL
jgi:hypothetical protein